MAARSGNYWAAGAGRRWVWDAWPMEARQAGTDHRRACERARECLRESVKSEACVQLLAYACFRVSW